MISLPCSHPQDAAAVADAGDGCGGGGGLCDVRQR